MSFSRLLLLVLIVMTVTTCAARKPAWHQGVVQSLVKKELEFGGLKRSYFLYVPKNLTASQPTPVVFALHGGGLRADGASIAQTSERKFEQLADQEPFLVVYPNGWEFNWNDGRGGQDLPTQARNVDDVGFIEVVLKDIAKSWAVNLKRVYVTGISNGGFMSMRLACDRPQLFAAIAPVVASLPKAHYEKCKKTAVATSVLMINGRQDPLVPWKGGNVGFQFNKKARRGQSVAIEEAFQFWAQKAKCQGPAKITALPDVNTQDHSTVQLRSYPQCDQGHEVLLYDGSGSGHTWPGGWQYMPAALVGYTNRDFDASTVIWEFFKRHSREN